MAQNLFTTELLKQYSGTYTSNYGEWVLRNGVWVMRLGPVPIYNTNSLHRGLTSGEFKTNTRYVFDFWIDTDDIYYDGVSDNVPGGISFGYTDGTSINLTVKGNRSTPLGFQHIRLITAANKTLAGICPYYYISTPAYYRYDSSITEFGESDIDKNGVLTTQLIKEPYINNTTSIYKGGIITANEIKEI